MPSNPHPLEQLSRPTQEQIAQRAYELWMAAGCPEGRDEENWLAAENQLVAEMLRTPPQKPKVPAKPARQAAARINVTPVSAELNSAGRSWR